MKQQADELFELSHSSWSEIEDELTDALKTSAQFGPRRSLLRIGENNVSGWVLSLATIFFQKIKYYFVNRTPITIIPSMGSHEERRSALICEGGKFVLSGIHVGVLPSSSRLDRLLPRRTNQTSDQDRLQILIFGRIGGCCAEPSFVQFERRCDLRRIAKGTVQFFCL